MNLLHNAIKFSPDGGDGHRHRRRAPRRSRRLGHATMAWASRPRTRRASSSASTRSTVPGSAAWAAPAWAWPSPATSPRPTAAASGWSRSRARARPSASRCRSPSRGSSHASSSGGTSQRSSASPSPSLVCRSTVASAPFFMRDAGRIDEVGQEQRRSPGRDPRTSASRAPVSSSSAHSSRLPKPSAEAPVGLDGHVQDAGHDLGRLLRAHQGAADDDVGSHRRGPRGSSPSRSLCLRPLSVSGRRSSSPIHSNASPAWACRSRCTRTLPELGEARPRTCAARVARLACPPRAPHRPKPLGAEGFVREWGRTAQSPPWMSRLSAAFMNRSMRWLMAVKTRAEGGQPLLLAAVGRGRIVVAPVEALALAREDRAGLAGRVAHGDDVVEACAQRTRSTDLERRPSVGRSRPRAAPAASAAGPRRPRCRPRRPRRHRRPSRAAAPRP